LHLKHIIETGEDMEKSLVTPTPAQLAQCNAELYAARRLNRARLFVSIRKMLPGDEALNGRTQEILNSIVRAYIETGEPVGSRTVSKRRKDGLSPASIRNAMADLADEGIFRSRTHPPDACHRESVSLLCAVAGSGPHAGRRRPTRTRGTQ
jgi:hypothetical protein